MAGCAHTHTSTHVEAYVCLRVYMFTREKTLGPAGMRITETHTRDVRVKDESDMLMSRYYVRGCFAVVVVVGNDDDHAAVYPNNGGGEGREGDVVLLEQPHSLIDCIGQSSVYAEGRMSHSLKQCPACWTDDYMPILRPDIA